MGGAKSEKDAMTRQAAAQERVAGTQERLGNEQIAQSKEDRAFQKMVYEKLGPYAEKLIGTFDPAARQDLVRPDQTPQIRRDYFDNLAAIEQAKHTNIAGYEDVMTSSGMGGSGLRSAGVGSILRGAGQEQATARRDMQARRSEEGLAGYYDKVDRSNENAQLGLAGVNVLAGQQGVFNPAQSVYAAQGGLNMAGAGYGGAAQTTYNKAQLPGAWSKIGAIAGAGLGIAKNIWTPGIGAMPKG